MILNVVKMALLAAIVLVATNVVDPYDTHPTKRFAFSVVAVAVLAGFGMGFDVALLLVVLAILNTAPNSKEAYQANTERAIVEQEAGGSIVEEEKAVLMMNSVPENNENAASSPTIDVVRESEDEGDRVADPPIIPEVDPDDMASPPPPVMPPPITDDKEECVPEFIVSSDMLRAAQTNVVSAKNADLFPNETQDPNINIQGLFVDVSGYTPP